MDRSVRDSSLEWLKLVLTHLSETREAAVLVCGARSAWFGITFSLLGLGIGCSTPQPMRQEVSRAIEGWERPVFRTNSTESGEHSDRAVAESAAEMDALEGG